MATSVVFPRVQFFANNGRPLIGGRIHTYVAGSSTRARTYKDAAKAQPNANPIILDARGEASVYLADGVEYKFVIEDSNGALIMTQEPVYGAIWPNAAEWPSDATLSYQYMTEAKAAADTIGPIRFYDTKAQATAALPGLANGEIVEVESDETMASGRTRYRITAGSMVFVVNLDQLRQDVASTADPNLGASMVGGIIAKSLTINVPSQYATIQAAMDYLRGYTIARGVTVTIKVADGVYAYTSSVSLNHPDGEKIRLIGNAANPTACTLQTDGASNINLLVCSNGHKFGYIDGFYIHRLAKADLAKNVTGVLADAGATIFCGPNMEVNNYYYSFAARNGSYMSCAGVTSRNAGDVGIWAFCGSMVYARNAKAYDAADTTNGYGFGFQAEYGSTVDCTGGMATGCHVAGMAALSNGQLRAYDSNSSNNTGSGYLARDGGGIVCHNATASNNGRFAMERIVNGVIESNGVTATGNTLGKGDAKAFLSSDLGARVAASKGPLRVDTSSADPIYAHTSGGLQFVIDHADSATSRLRAKGGGAWSADQPALSADGAAANISIRYVSKGTGAHYFSTSDGAVQFEVAAAANCVNHLSATGAKAGEAVGLRAAGADSVIDVAIFPKGAGSYVQLGSGWVSNAAITPSGFIYIKDASGTVRKLMTCN